MIQDNFQFLDQFILSKLDTHLLTINCILGILILFPSFIERERQRDREREREKRKRGRQINRERDGDREREEEARERERERDLLLNSLTRKKSPVVCY